MLAGDAIRSLGLGGADGDVRRVVVAASPMSRPRHLGRSSRLPKRRAAGDTAGHTTKISELGRRPEHAHDAGGEQVGLWLGRPPRASRARRHVRRPAQPAADVGVQLGERHDVAK